MDEQTTSQPTPATSADDAGVIVGAPVKAGDKDERLGGAQTTQPIFSAPTPPAEAAPTWQSELDAVAGTKLSEASVPTATPPLFVKKEVPRYPDGKRPDGTDLDKGEKLLAAIGYVGILALVPLLLRRNSSYCQHHGSQGLVLGAILMVVETIARIIGSALFGLEVFFSVLIFIAWVVGFMLAFSGSWFRIPVIYDWAQDLNLFAEEVDKENRLKNQEDR